MWRCDIVKTPPQVKQSNAKTGVQHKDCCWCSHTAILSDLTTNLKLSAHLMCGAHAIPSHFSIIKRMDSAKVFHINYLCYLPWWTKKLDCVSEHLKSGLGWWVTPSLVYKLFRGVGEGEATLCMIASSKGDCSQLKMIISHPYLVRIWSHLSICLLNNFPFSKFKTDIT